MTANNSTEVRFVELMSQLFNWMKRNGWISAYTGSSEGITVKFGNSSGKSSMNIKKIF